MCSRLGGWSRLAVALCVPWVVGVTALAAVCWLRLAYGSALASPPFAYWELPSAAPRSLPGRLVVEWGQAFGPTLVQAAPTRGYVPRFGWSVYFIFLLGPPVLVTLTALAARWVLDGFRGGRPAGGVPRLDEEALLPFGTGLEAEDGPPPPGPAVKRADQGGRPGG
jgi:hypothetical protein